MSDFPPGECDYVYLEGGANDGVIVPVARGLNMIQFHIAGGGLITYRRLIPAQRHNDHPIVRYVP